MVGMEKLKYSRTKSPSRRLNELDRISHLPDDLVCHILSHLPTNDAIKTSVLSTRWRSLWLCVPSLELAYWDFPNFNAFKSFGDMFFDSNRVSCIHKVKLNIDHENRSNTSYLKSLIDAAVKRKIQHLDVRCSPDTAYKMPLSLYSCEALVSLKLFAVEVTLDDLKFVSLPCVKTMHLKYIHYGNKATYEATFERLVSCCPVLEELKIFAYAWYSETVYRVLSRSLKKLRIKIAVDYKDCVSRFVIDTPRLSFLSIKNNLSESFIINNMESNAKVEISLPFGFDYFDEASVSSRRSSIRRFLYGISKVRDMTICRDTFKLICQYSKLEPLPQFGCMSRLRVTLDVSDFQLLPTFLESCANLKSLILVWNGDSNKMPFDGRLNPRIRFYPVPECLLSSLEFVDLKTSISGYTPEIKLVRYFLENSTLLKKVALRLNYYCTNEKLIVKELLEIPRRSVTCQVVIY